MREQTIQILQSGIDLFECTMFGAEMVIARQPGPQELAEAKARYKKAEEKIINARLCIAWLENLKQ